MKHPLTLTTPLPPGHLRLSAMAARQGVGVLDELELELLSDKSDIVPTDLLGKPMEVTCQLAKPEDGIGSSGKRFIGGLCTRFGLGRPTTGGGAATRLFAYTATVRPWLWFLTRTSDCRIFQDKTVPEIVQKVFADLPGADFHFSLVRTYRKRVYCVQYRESDLNFVLRLLEDEGIWWFFEHTKGHQRMILIDEMASAKVVPGAESLPFMGAAGSGGMAPNVAHIDTWSSSIEVQSGVAAIQAYDFERPTGSLLMEYAAPRNHALANLEQYDYEGEAYLKADAEQRVGNRIDELASRFERLSGSTNAQMLAPGHQFELTHHPREDQNTKYLCMDMRIDARSGALESGSSGADWHCSFSAIPMAQVFRPPRRTPKPFVQGPQTAVVVGPAGEEIFTDKYSRVKVQFHWDRYGAKDERSSCWVRVSSPWAGKNFGFVQLPRIGQEVVVSFLEGDPDQPIITGRVYNAEQMPPWVLPDNATQSGIHTRSSKGGVYGNANTLRFEDKKGAEQVLIHAEKDMSTSVENDQSTSVGHDQSTSVKNSQTTTVEKGRKVFVKSKGETYYVKDDRKIYVDAKQEQVVTKDSNNWVQVNMAEYVTGDRTLVTTGKWIFKSTEAHFVTGPKWFATADDVQVMSGKKTTLQAGTDFSMRATDFKISATNNINFTGNQFNRTIFEGNDTVLGNNTNTYIGNSRSTTMGPSVEVYSGFKNAMNVGVATETTLAMNVSSFIGLSISNALAVQMDNALLNLGMTGFDLTVAGMSIDNNAMKLLNGGGATGAGAATMFSGGAGIAALIAAGVGLAFGAGFGGAAAVDANSQANADIDALLKNPDLSADVKARLQRAMDSRFSHREAKAGTDDSSTDPVMAAQLASLANAASPPIDPAGSPASGATAPPAPGDPTAAP